MELVMELVMYTRTSGCPFVSLAKRVFNDYTVSFREVFIDKDPEARARVLNWTGFLAVPTLVVAQPGEILPYEEPGPLAKGSSPRGVDRGAMITEPGYDQLVGWLRRHGFVAVEDASEDVAADAAG